MGLEIERKFLVTTAEGWKGKVPGTKYVQGYLGGKKDSLVRVRRAGDRGFITIKGMPSGNKRKEYEYEIPVSEANEILEQLCEKPLIEKVRYVLDYAGKKWEIDEFLCENTGLVLAEVELSREDEPLLLPPWVGEEVTGDPRYLNINLVKNPYQRWNRR